MFLKFYHLFLPLGVSKHGVFMAFASHEKGVTKTENAWGL